MSRIFRQSISKSSNSFVTPSLNLTPISLCFVLLIEWFISPTHREQTWINNRMFHYVEIYKYSPSGAPTLTCLEPSQGQFVTATCKASCSSSDPQHRTTTESCTIPSSVEYVTSTCVTGSSNIVGSNTLVSTCIVPSADSFVTAACLNGDIATPGTNTLISTCSSPGDDEFVTAVCVKGDTNTVGRDTVITKCPPGQYLTAETTG